MRFIVSIFCAAILCMTANSEGKLVKDVLGIMSEGFRLSAHPLSVQTQVDNPVLLRLTIKNMTKKDLEVQEALPHREYEIEVRDSRGDTVSLTAFGQQLLKTRGIGFRDSNITVASGGERENTIDIAKLRDLSIPGTYYVKAKRRVKKLNGEGWGEVASNMVRVTIVK